MILGDNIFYGNGFSRILKNAVKNAQENGRATVFGYYAVSYTHLDVYKRQAQRL